MILIIGLGNPGQKYRFSRHNIGFNAIDLFAKENDFPPFRLSEKFFAEVSGKQLVDNEIMLAKPQTFMNLSGKTAKKLSDHYRILPENIWVVHDDLDLMLGKIKISFGHGSGGHKGVESVIKTMDTKDFVRFRIGIGDTSKKPENVELFVLQKPNKEERKILSEAIGRTSKAISCAIKENLEKAMNEYNQ